VGGGFYRVTAHYGFMEKPLVSNLISLAREKGMDFDLEKTAFFLGRINLMPGRAVSFPSCPATSWTPPPISTSPVPR